MNGGGGQGCPNCEREKVLPASDAKEWREKP